MREKKKCLLESCTTLTGAKSGYCTPHWYHSQKKNGAPAKRGPKPKLKAVDVVANARAAQATKNGAPKIARTVAVTHGGNMQPTSVTQLATIEVSEAHLDKLWTGMSLLEKAAAITQSLRAGVL